MDNKEKVVVIIPTYNEKDNIGRMADALAEVYKEHNLFGYLLITDANSNDGTIQIVDELAKKYSSGNYTVRVIHEEKKKGLGRAYVDCFKYCIKDKVDLILQMDADFSHPVAKVIELIQAVRDGADMAIGSRYVKGGGVQDWGLMRIAISRFGSFYSRMILGVPINDYTGGFTCFKRAVIEKITPDSLKANGYSFQVELKYKVYKAGFKVVEVPILFIDRKFGKSKMSKNIVFEAMKNVWLLKFGKI